MPGNSFKDKELARKAGQSKGKHKKTKEWEALAESIVTTHAERFNTVLKDLPDEDFVKIYKDILNYFKPKMQHVTQESEEKQVGPVEIKIINPKEGD